MVDWINHVCAIFFLTSLYQYNQTSNAINFFTLIYMYKVILYKNVHSLSNRAILKHATVGCVERYFQHYIIYIQWLSVLLVEETKVLGGKGGMSKHHKLFSLLQVVSFLQEECHSIRASCAFDQSGTTSERNLCTSQSRRRV